MNKKFAITLCSIFSFSLAFYLIRRPQSFIGSYTSEISQDSYLINTVIDGSLPSFLFVLFFCLLFLLLRKNSSYLIIFLVSLAGVLIEVWQGIFPQSGSYDAYDILACIIAGFTALVFAHYVPMLKVNNLMPYKILAFITLLVSVMATSEKKVPVEEENPILETGFTRPITRLQCSKTDASDCDDFLSFSTPYFTEQPIVFFWSVEPSLDEISTTDYDNFYSVETELSGGFADYQLNTEAGEELCANLWEPETYSQLETIQVIVSGRQIMIGYLAGLVESLFDAIFVLYSDGTINEFDSNILNFANFRVQQGLEVEKDPVGIIVAYQGDVRLDLCGNGRIIEKSKAVSFEDISNYPRN